MRRAGGRPKGWLLLALVVLGLAVWAAARAVGAGSGASAAVGPAGPLPPASSSEAADLRVETLVSGLDTPWDLAWGPDGWIWVTERPGRISRVDPASGELRPAGTLEVVERGESGLMGLAFHPDFDREPYVYVAHSYAAPGAIRNRLVRLRWNGERLGTPETLVDAIPGNWNHDGSRLAFGPDGFLYVTTGDAGRAALAQDLTSLAGKLLRLTPEGQAAPGNPFGSRVHSYGHRNPQGIVFHPATDDLYISEHGPRDNDEVTRVVAAADHGWPAVHGFCDGDVGGEEAYCRDHDVVEPMAAWTPTVAVAGMDYYGADLVPGWRGSLLVTSLRGRTLFRLALSADGGSVVEREALFRDEFGRLRDVLVGPAGVVYLATSNRDGRGRPAPEDDRILRVTR